MWPDKEEITKILVQFISGPDKKFDDLRESWFTKHLIIALRETIWALLLVVKGVYDNLTVKGAEGGELDDKGYDYGVTRNEATKALHTVTICKSAAVKYDTPIPDGFMLTTTPVQNNAPVKFTVVPGQNKIIMAGGKEAKEVIVECTEHGETGNVPDGAINLVAQPGFDSVTDSEVYKKAVSREEDEPYRERILARKRSPARSGVPADWERWAMEVSGVSKATAFRAARGPGTVDVVIWGTGGSVPDTGLVLDCQNYLDTLTPADMADGGVLVCAPGVVPIDITLADVEAKNGYSDEDLRAILARSFEEFFSESTGAKRITVVDCIVTVRTAYDNNDVSRTPVVSNFTLLEPSCDIYLTGRQAPEVRNMTLTR